MLTSRQALEAYRKLPVGQQTIIREGVELLCAKTGIDLADGLLVMAKCCILALPGTSSTDEETHAVGHKEE